MLYDKIYARHRQDGVRRIQGVLSLAKKHGAVVVDDACGAAIEIGVFEYRFVKKWIQRHPPSSMTLRQVDPLIRELTYYRDFINNKTRKEIS